MRWFVLLIVLMCCGCLSAPQMVPARHLEAGEVVVQGGGGADQVLLTTLGTAGTTHVGGGASVGVGVGDLGVRGAVVGVVDDEVWLAPYVGAHARLYPVDRLDATLLVGYVPELAIEGTARVGGQRQRKRGVTYGGLQANHVRDIWSPDQTQMWFGGFYVGTSCDVSQRLAVQGEISNSITFVDTTYLGTVPWFHGQVGVAATYRVGGPRKL